MSSVNTGSFYFLSHLSSFYLFIFFLPNRLIHYNNTSGESEYPYLVLSLREKAFNLSSLSMMLPVSFHDALSHIKKALSILVCGVFIF